jgi:hypothetical protein
MGVFLYRSSNGNGTLSANNIRLNWSYSDNGVQTSDTLDIRLFAIEMVYVPEGSFYAGDFAHSTGAFRQGSSDNDPWYIGSENAINVANINGSGTGVGRTNLEYYYVAPSPHNDSGFTTGSSFTIPADYPKGFAPLYVMKYEITQRQWIGFFNTLTDTQKDTLDITRVFNGKNSDSLSDRNNVNWTSGDAILNNGTHGDVVCGFLHLDDLLSYLEWSALRPMTELEYEKIARGANKEPISGEFAWGSSSIVNLVGINFDGLPNEEPSSYSNTYSSITPLGPLRVGIFAKSSTTRVDSGSSYYGAMNLSDNVYEKVVTTAFTNSLSFVGQHGDGSLNGSGYSDFDVIGMAFRSASYLPWESATGGVSDRYVAAVNHNNRYGDNGGRGVRSAP